MSIVVPAILEKDRVGFQEKANMLKSMSSVERVQIDFADGKFVNNTTISVEDLESLNPSFTWEAHIMHESPTDFLDYHICGFSTCIIHYEAFKDNSELKKAIEKIKSTGMSAGLAINPNTPVEVCKEYEGLVSQFLIMAVEPGFQGAPFIETTYQKIQELRKLIPHATIEIDGGVKTDNIQKLKDAGADYLAAGSSLFSQTNPSESYTKLRDLIS